MKSVSDVGLLNVQEVYSGNEGRLWERIMGEQIHIGGLVSSQDLASKAQIGPGTHGVDFCCCAGAGMRFLHRFCQVAHMTGVDATAHVVELWKQRTEEEGLTNKTLFVLADVTDCGLPDNKYDCKSCIYHSWKHYMQKCSLSIH